jgi:integrase
MASYRKRGRHWTYRFVDENGKPREVKGHYDLTTTKGMARRAEERVADIRAGKLLAEPPPAPPEPGVRERLDAYAAYLRSIERDPKHVLQTTRYASRTCDIAEIVKVGDLTADKVLSALDQLRDEGLSARTRNAHLTAIKALSAWLTERGYVAKNPLASLRRFKFNAKADRRLERRALSVDELRRLIETTREAPDFMGMSGLDRSVLYLTAANTGYRRSELGALMVSDFALDDDPPAITCSAASTKDGEPARQPIPGPVASVLRSWVASKAPDRPVFDLPDKTGQMVKADAQSAGIDAGDTIGVIDMHSLRHSYITNLIRSGVPATTAKELARHSDINLTLDVYTHLGIHDHAPAVANLPDLTVQSRPSERARATGTHGSTIHKHPIECPIGGVGGGRDVTEAGGTDPSGPVLSASSKPYRDGDLDAPCRGTSDTVGSAPRRTRTYNPLIKRHDPGGLDPRPNSDADCTLRHRPVPLQVLIPLTKDHQENRVFRTVPEGKWVVSG